MKIIAHRGYSGLYPENTMLAFDKAAEAGAGEIELDVQMSKDGVVVVYHDEGLERLTGQEGFLKDFNFGDLKKLNVSKMVYGDKYGFNPMPSLDEYLGWVKNTGIATNIELKNSRIYYEGLEEKTIELVIKHGLEEKVYFSSFLHLSLIKCKKINPAIPCGALLHIPLGKAGYFVRTNGLDYFHPEIKTLTEETAASCAEQGVGINVWTVNDMPGLYKAKSLNCRGIITDFPDIAKAYFGA